MRTFHAILSFFAVAVLFGMTACQTSGSSGGTTRSSPAPAAVSEVPAPAAVAPGDLDIPIHLHSIYNSIGRGRVIDDPKVDLLSCARPIVELSWAMDPDQDAAAAAQPDFREAFRRQGLDLIEDQTSAFVASDALDRADILLAGVIVDFSIRSCRWGWDNTYAGDAEITIRWEAYSQRRDQVIYSETLTSTFTESKHQHDIDDFLGLTLKLAARDLAANRKFREALASLSTIPTQGAQQTQAAWDTLVVPGTRESSQAFTSNPDPVLDATVVLVSGSSHGSGFVVSADGYILTNAHVVGKRDSMTVRFRDGREYEGRILRRHGERDIALVKIDARSLPVLPLRSQAAKVGEAVFSIGAPRFQALESTVSSGIVSAYRAGLFDGYDIIQSDAIIHDGNSGGPLVDRNGNVVAIAVSGITDSAQKLGSGIGFFIPIASGLKTLKLAVR
jgi:S1-C subfamily serine protease